MLISTKNKFIFIHVYKTGGSSVHRVLAPHCETRKFRWRFFSRLSALNYGNYSDDFPGHISASELKSRLPNSTFDSCFKFAFVRNPWDWQVSLYHFALQNKSHHQHDITRKFNSYLDYLEWRVNHDFHLQKDFIYDDKNQCLLDFVGRFENLQSHLNLVLKGLGLSQIQLPVINRSEHQPFSSYYTRESDLLIRKYFAPDIELFGYLNQGPSY